MSVRKSVWCSLILLLSLKSSVFSQSPAGVLTLKQAVETAITNNLNVKQSDLLQQTAGVNLRQAKANLLPDLFGNISHGINQGRSIDPFTNSYSNQQINFANYNLSSSVVLFSGFQLLNAIRQNSLTYDATKMELQQQKDNITLSVILAYLQILNNQELLNQSNNQAALSRKQVERLEILHNVGAIAPALLYDLRGQLASDELGIINTQNALDAGKLTLSQLLNIPFDRNLQVEPITTEQLIAGYQGDVESIFQSALQQLAIVKAVDLREKSAQKAVQVARGGYSPTLFLSGNYSTNYSSAARRDIFINTIDVPTDDYVIVNGNKVNVFTQQGNFNSQKIGFSDQFKNNYNTSVSLGLRIPILNSFFVRNQVALAKINHKNAQYTSESTKIQLKQGVEQAFFNMKAAEGRFKVLLDQVNAFTESFKAAEVRFNAGVGTSVDYLVAKNNLDAANLNLVSAKYDYVLRMKVLDYYQSKPLW